MNRNDVESKKSNLEESMQMAPFRKEQVQFGIMHLST